MSDVPVVSKNRAPELAKGDCKLREGSGRKTGTTSRSLLQGLDEKRTETGLLEAATLSVVTKSIMYAERRGRAEREESPRDRGMQLQVIQLHLIESEVSFPDLVSSR